VRREVEGEEINMSQFKKYPKIYRLGSEEVTEFLDFNEDTVVVEEKVDGGNFSTWLDEDGSLHVGSRNRDLTEEQDEKTFAKQRAYLTEKLKDKKLNPDYIYYLECMATHTIKYSTAPDMIGIDIRLKRSMVEGEYGLFLARDLRCQLFDELGIENVPLVWRGTIGELKKQKIEYLIPKSKYYDGKAEGICLKNYCRKSRQGNHQLYAKVVADEFKENNKAVFGGVRKKDTDTEKIVEQYCTQARVYKQINRLTQEDGKPLQMDLMRYLPQAVSKDILQEEITEIFEAYKWLDFKSFKNFVSKKCVKYLQEFMLNKHL
jgi:ATP-dependent RNA circularization protein (DNA/RNA ligase family)